jgi:ribosomal protein S18 acetylase RimI-like enzyme
MAARKKAAPAPRRRTARDANAAQAAQAAGPAARRAKALDVVVRAATPLDLDEVVALRLALLRDPEASPFPRLLHPDAERRARSLFAKQLRSPREVVFLAHVGDETVGLLRVVAAPRSPLHAELRHAYLTSAFVVPAARARGVMRALVQHAMAWCEAHDVHEVRLHNALRNRAAAAVWDRLGFPAVEELRVRRLPPH